MLNKVPFLEDLRVSFHQVIRDVITRQILEDVSGQPLHLKDNKTISTATYSIDTSYSVFHHMIP